MVRLIILIAIVGALLYKYQPQTLSQLKENPVVQKSTKQILGVANNMFARQASKSAELVGDFVLSKTSSPILSEYKKLPPRQQEIIKKEVCK